MIQYSVVSFSKERSGAFVMLLLLVVVVTFAVLSWLVFVARCPSVGRPWCEVRPRMYGAGRRDEGCDGYCESQDHLWMAWEKEMSD